jgi:AraC-like DNA-binding protein
MQLLDDGGYAIDDRVEIPGDGSDYFVFTSGWLMEILEVEDGEFYFVSDGHDVKPASSRFGIFYSPFTITRPFVRSFKANVRGVGSHSTVSGLPAGPYIFETDFDGQFLKASDAVDVIAASRNRRSIETNTKPSQLSVKIKGLIDDNYLAFPSMSRIADRLEVSPEHLSRQFKRDFGLSPSSYLNKLRVADATFRLSIGEPIIEISQDVGYNDLSRFYKQFRKTTKTSPAACRATLTE